MNGSIDDMPDAVTNYMRYAYELFHVDKRGQRWFQQTRDALNTSLLEDRPHRIELLGSVEKALIFEEGQRHLLDEIQEMINQYEKVARNDNTN